jgi:hypothetical protein
MRPRPEESQQTKLEESQQTKPAESEQTKPAEFMRPDRKSRRGRKRRFQPVSPRPPAPSFSVPGLSLGGFSLLFEVSAKPKAPQGKSERRRSQPLARSMLRYCEIIPQRLERSSVAWKFWRL